MKMGYQRLTDPNKVLKYFHPFRNESHVRLNCYWFKDLENFSKQNLIVYDNQNFQPKIKGGYVQLLLMVL